MQGERASLGSLSESLNFDHGSTSSNGRTDQEIRWGNIHNLSDMELQDYMIPATDTNTTFVNSVYHEQCDLHNSSEQSIGIRCFEEQRNERLDLNPLFVQPSIANHAVRNADLNAEYNGHLGDMNPVRGHPGLFDANGLSSVLLPPCRPFEESSIRACSSGRRASCKRKAFDGQPSLNGGFRDFQRGESSSRVPPPVFNNQGNGLNISSSFDYCPRGLISGSVPNLFAPAIPGNCSRDFSAGINPSDQQETVNPAAYSAGSVIRRPVGPPSNSQELLPADQHQLNLRYGHSLGNVVSQNPNASITRIPPVSRTVLPPFQWTGNRVVAGPSSSAATFDRNVIHLDETRPRSVSGNNLENPLFVEAPELRNLPHSYTRRNPSDRNLIGAGNVALSSSRIGVQPSISNSAWTPYQSNSPHHQTRLTEHVHRSSLSSLVLDATNQRASDHPAFRSFVPLASPDEHALQSSYHNIQVHNQASSRASPWLERQGERNPHSLRVLTNASRGRRRMVASEIRNLIDLMRRGENLRFEDVMLLNQSMLLGMADIHDRYRDMRLDVDNMTYEELLRLEERIGDVCTGLSEETISNRLKKQKYQSSKGCEEEVEPCCICQEEYKEGEDMGILECGHDFHGECIKEWLKRKNLCPICKTTGLDTSKESKGE